MIGIIGAMNDEVCGLVARLEDIQSRYVGGVKFFYGLLEGKEVVVAQSGVGKVNASMTVSLLLALFPKTNAIISTGVAGGIGKKLRQGDVVISSACVQHDFILNDPQIPLGQVAGFDFVEFPCDRQLMDIAEKALQNIEIFDPLENHQDTATALTTADKPQDIASSLTGVEKTLQANRVRYHRGIIATGDEFVKSNQKAAFLNQQFGAIACDMESCALAQVCYRMGIKFLSIRSISDGGDDTAATDFEQFLARATQISIACTISLIKQL